MAISTIKVAYRDMVKFVAERGESHIRHNLLYVGSLSPGRSSPSDTTILGGVRTRRIPVLKVRYRPLEIFVTLGERYD